MRQRNLPTMIKNCDHEPTRVKHGPKRANIIAFAGNSFVKKSRNILKKKRKMISIEKKLYYLAAGVLQHPHSIVVSRLPQVLTTIMINIISIFFLLLLFIIFLLIIMRIFGVVDSTIFSNYLCSCSWFPNVNLNTWASTLRMASPTCSLPVTSAAIPGNIWQVDSSYKEYKKRQKKVKEKIVGSSFIELHLWYQYWHFVLHAALYRDAQT